MLLMRDSLRENPQGLDIADLIRKVRLKHGDVRNFGILDAKKVIEVACESGLVELTKGICQTRWHLKEDIYFLSDK